MKKGKLIKVEISPGRFVKMYEQDAIAQGLVKQRPAAEDKMRRAGGDKSAIGEVSTPPARGGRGGAMAAANSSEDNCLPIQGDDFTTIDGIGPATARALQARGIRTFAELREATALGFLSGAAQNAIERWRDDPDG